ncbi:MAG: competence protein ComEA [Microgenomates group bacterium Gr01-1014_5]|nr:MAG: competence protein ComEA [Microgenomates group bacterium Gr01-1014_5]
MSEFFLSEESEWKAKIQAWFEKYRLLLIAGLGGLFLLFGGFSFLSGVFEQPKVEILESGGGNEGVSGVEGDESKITVEVSGAVVKPGVYELLASDRVERLLIASGGLSATADREWVEKYVNRAAKLLDGQKIYIPAEGELSVVGGGSSSAGKLLGVQTGLININSATQSELEKLKGIGPARAAAIIENRPYAAIDELVSKKVIGKKLLDEIKEQITAP